MIKKYVSLTLILFSFLLFFDAKADNTINKNAQKVIDSLKIEIATKGKNLNEYFSGNTIKVIFNDKKLQFKFSDKNYEIYELDKIIEKGKWKLSGIFKNQIKLKPENKKKTYYLKKISKKNKIYHFNGSPANESTIKTLIQIISSEKADFDNKKQVKKTDNSDLSKEKTQNDKDIKKKKKEKKQTNKLKKKKEKKEKKTKPKKYRYIELTENQEKKLAKYKERSKKIRIIKSEDSYIETTKGGDTQANQYKAAEHCAKNKLFAYSFKDSGMGLWYEPPFKRAKYFYCSDQLIFTNPFTNKEVTWTNYEKKEYFKYPNEHLYLYRTMTSTYKRSLEKEKKKNPKAFKLSPFKIIYKDENSVHIKGFYGGDLNKERYIANEHCSQFNKKYYYFEDSIDQGLLGAMLFTCSDKHLASNPFSGEPLKFISGSENYSHTAQKGSNLNASEMLKYNSTNYTTFHFFEASDNMMKSLELLYRAYDKNVEADKLKAQINYNRESKYSAGDKLQSTRSIIDSSSIEIKAKISDASVVLSDIGRSYYEQSLPYAYNAAQSSYELIITIKNTFEQGTQDTDSLLVYANEFIGFFTIAKDLPQLATDIFTTSKLVFNGAKVKKIKDKGNLNKALDELTLD